MQYIVLYRYDTGEGEPNLKFIESKRIPAQQNSDVQNSCFEIAFCCSYLSSTVANRVPIPTWCWWCSTSTSVAEALNLAYINTSLTCVHDNYIYIVAINTAKYTALEFCLIWKFLFHLYLSGTRPCPSVVILEVIFRQKASTFLKIDATKRKLLSDLV